MMYRDMDHVCRRAEQQEREAARKTRLLAEAKAVADPERYVDAADESDIIVADESALHIRFREPGRDEVGTPDDALGRCDECGSVYRTEPGHWHLCNGDRAYYTEEDA